MQQQQLENVRFLIRLSTESERIAAIAAFLLVKKPTSCSTLAEALNLAMQMLPSSFEGFRSKFTKAELPVAVRREPRSKITLG